MINIHSDLFEYLIKQNSQLVTIMNKCLTAIKQFDNSDCKNEFVSIYLSADKLYQANQKEITDLLSK